MTTRRETFWHPRTGTRYEFPMDAKKYLGLCSLRSPRGKEEPGEDPLALEPCPRGPHRGRPCGHPPPGHVRLGKVQREVLRLASLSGPGWEGLPVGYGMGETRRVTGGDLPLHVSERRAYLILQRLRELDLVEPVYHERFPGMEDYYRATPEGRALLTRRFDDPYTD